MLNSPAYRSAGVAALLACLQSAATAAAPPTLTSSQPVIYRLNDQSTFTQGCFDPCLCPIWLSGPFRGAYALRLVDQGPLLSTYNVEQVNWLVSLGGEDVHITGSGTYQRGNALVPLHRMELDLHIGENETQHFDSGWVTAQDALPAINITISINGMFCYDTVMDLRSKPVPAGELTRYGLASGSAFIEGCFGMCLCPLWMQPLGGTFTLAPIANFGTYREYAVMNVRWRTQPNAPTLTSVSQTHVFTGSGLYTHIDGFAGPIHQMELNLLDMNESQHFDSGLLNAESNFPRIDIVMSMHGMECFDTVLDIRAMPMRSSATAASLTSAVHSLSN